MTKSLMLSHNWPIPTPKCKKKKILLSASYYLISPIVLVKQPLFLVELSLLFFNHITLTYIAIKGRLWSKIEGKYFIGIKLIHKFFQIMLFNNPPYLLGYSSALGRMVARSFFINNGSIYLDKIQKSLAINPPNYNTILTCLI